MTVIDFKHEKYAREANALAVRAELLAFAQESQFPGGQTIDQVTLEPTLDEEAETTLLRMFAVFGVADLNPLDPDFELVSNTWYELNMVGSHLRSRQLFEDTLFKAQQQIWHPTYKAYVDALWRGDLAAIAEGAAAMGIQEGIPEYAGRLRDGPIQLRAKKGPQ